MNKKVAHNFEFECKNCMSCVLLDKKLCEEGHVDMECVLDIEVTPFRAGKYDGLPENCYPDEGGFCEIVSAYYEGENIFEILVDLGQINEELSESIYEMLMRDALEIEAEERLMNYLDYQDHEFECEYRESPC